jgi:hypothetical protein
MCSTISSNLKRELRTLALRSETENSGSQWRFDKQGSCYAASADLAAAIPVHHGDEIGGQIQFIRYDGAQKFLSIPVKTIIWQKQPITITP